MDDKNLIATIICDHPGITYKELVDHVQQESICSIPRLRHIVTELVEDHGIIEVGYSLPYEDHEKSLFFPRGTCINIYGGKKKNEDT
jgi:hypothetical protein